MDQLARTPKQVGAAIRRRRRRVGLTQKRLGEQTRLRQATISALENGERGTQLRTLLDVVTALGLEIVIRERSTGRNIEDIF